MTIFRDGVQAVRRAWRWGGDVPRAVAAHAVAYGTTAAASLQDGGAPEAASQVLALAHLNVSSAVLAVAGGSIADSLHDSVSNGVRIWVRRLAAPISALGMTLVAQPRSPAQAVTSAALGWGTAEGGKIAHDRIRRWMNRDGRAGTPDRNSHNHTRR